MSRDPSGMDAIDFLRKDYELKVNYLSGHFTRMWTRFNYFLTIESALFAFSFTKEGCPNVWLIATVGFALSVLWYIFASADNYLVEVYRRQVAHVFHLLSKSREAAFQAEEIDPRPAGYSYVGSICDMAFNPATSQVEPIEQSFRQRRFPRFSATELGVAFAVLYGVVWAVRPFV